MKVEVIIMLSMLGVISQATKQLKIPRIYNALITSDEMLLPSQAYPAITPIISGVQYPVALNGFIAPSPYHLIANVPASTTLYGNVNGDGALSYALRQENYPDYGIGGVEYSGLERQPAFIEDQNQIPNDKNSNNNNNNNINNFNPVVENNPPNSVQASRQYLSPNYAPTLEQRKKFYPGYAQEFGVAPPVDSAVEDNQLSQQPKSSPQEEEPVQPQFPISPLPVGDSANAIKNNRPSNPDIVDVPPPPLPIKKQSPSAQSDQKKPNEYPPAPVPFI